MQQNPTSPDSSFETFESADVYPWTDASRSQRLAAAILDVLFIGLLQALGQAFMKGLAFDFALSFIPLLYYVFSHTYGGQTLGKKIVGLKVVRFDATLDAESVSFGKIFLRESLGRGVSTVFLMIGYLRIFYSSDRRGWHDLIGKTRVVSIAPEAAHSVGLKHVFGVLFVIAAVGVGAIHYLATSTEWPMREFAKRLELDGFEVEGIGGNVREGFTIARLSKKTPEREVEIRGIFVKKKEAAASHVLLIDTLKISSAEVRVKKWTDESFELGIKSSMKNTFVKTFDAEKLSVSLPDGKAYDITRLFVSDIEEKKNEKLAIGRVWIESKTFDLDVRDLSVEVNTAASAKAIRGVIKPEMNPDLIKTPIDFHGEVSAQNGEIAMLQLQAFKNRMSLSLKNDKVALSIAEWTPSHFFKTEMPIWNVDLKLAGEWKGLRLDSPLESADSNKMRFDDPVGSVGVRSVRFDFAGDRLKHDRDGTKFVMVPRAAVGTKFFSGEEAAWLIGSTSRKDVPELLSEIYFGTLYEKLSGKQKEIVDKDQAYFMQIPQTMPDLIPIEEPSPVIRPIAVEAPAPPKRQPGSEGLKPGFDAKGRPLKLPPYRGSRH